VLVMDWRVLVMGWTVLVMGWTVLVSNSGTSRRFSPLQIFQTGSEGSHCLPHKGYRGPSSGVNWLGPQVGTLPLSSAGVRNEWSYKSVAPIGPHTSDRDTLTLR
jgi:hypothetical protein